MSAPVTKTDSVGATSAPTTRLSDYLELTKPRLSMLSVMTTLVGYAVVWPGWFPREFFSLMIGSAAAAAGVAALNQWMERDTDALMKRTADRPIPQGRIATGSAFVLGAGLSIGGLALVFAQVNGWAAVFLLLTIVSYLAVYTPAKRSSRWSTEIGAVAGAFPPLIGWAAATGGKGPMGWILFGILFCWQIPHFMAIAWLYRHDYAAVKFPMLPVRDTEGSQVAWWGLIHAVLVTLICLSPVLIGEDSWIYGIVSLVLGIWFCMRAAQMLRPEGRDIAARRLFFASIIWLPLQLGALVLDRCLR